MEKTDFLTVAGDTVFLILGIVMLSSAFGWPVGCGVVALVIYHKDS